MGAELLPALTGAWHVAHASARSGFSRWALCAITAAGVQGAIGGGAIPSLAQRAADEASARQRIALAQRVIAGLLAVTADCMVAVRYL